MVSPRDKNGGSVDRNLPVGQNSTSGASITGNAVAYVANMRFGGIASGSDGQYRSVRNPESGWSTRAINPPLQTDPSLDATGSMVWSFSPDLSQ